MIDKVLQPRYALARMESLAGIDETDRRICPRTPGARPPSVNGRWPCGREGGIRDPSELWRCVP